MGGTDVMLGEVFVMLSDREQFAQMEAVTVMLWSCGDDETLLVTSGRARDRLPVRCPVCGVEVGLLAGGQAGEVRRWSVSGRRFYYALHEEELHSLGDRGRRTCLSGRQGEGK